MSLRDLLGVVNGDTAMQFSSWFGDLTAAFAAYVAAKKGRGKPELHDFIRYLHDLHCDDAAKLIEQNERLSAGLASLMSGNHEEILDRLSSIDRRMAAMSALVAPELSGIAELVLPGASLSPQALSILVQMLERSGIGGTFMRVQCLGEPLCAEDGRQYRYLLDEPEDMDEDIEALLDLSLIRPASSGVRDDYQLTREGRRIARTLSRKPADPPLVT